MSPCAESVTVIYAGRTYEMFSKLSRHYADIKVRMGARERVIVSWFKESSQKGGLKFRC